jgi:hypothetical protein
MQPRAFPTRPEATVALPLTKFFLLSRSSSPFLPLVADFVNYMLRGRPGSVSGWRKEAGSYSDTGVSSVISVKSQTNLTCTKVPPRI